MRQTCLSIPPATPAATWLHFCRGKTAAGLLLAGLLPSSGGLAAVPAADRIATPTNEARVTLTAAGANPRRALRLHPQAGDTQRCAFTMQTGMEVEIGAMGSQQMKFPTLKTLLDTTVKRGTPGGGFEYEARFPEASITEDSDAFPQIIEGLRTTARALQGQTLAGRLSARGLSAPPVIVASTNLDVQSREALEQLHAAVAQASVVLPEAPVGLGAKWEVKQKVQFQGMTLDQTMTCTLVSLAGDQAVVQTEFTQAAAHQPMQVPAMPEVKLDVTKLSGHGTSKVTLDLRRLWPSAAAVDLHLDTELTLNLGDRPKELSMHLDLDLRLETK